jgi:thiol-disulfide isomerase/thioredoxin
MVKKNFVLLFLIVALSANSQSSFVKLNPEIPIKGDSIILTFNPENSSLLQSNQVFCSVYVNDLQSQVISKVVEIAMCKFDNGWKCKIPVNNNSISFIFSFSDTTGNKENNNGVGFKKTIYSNNKPLPFALGSIANLYASGWKTSFAFEQNNSLARKLFEEEFLNNPSSKREFVLSYLSTLSGSERDKEIIKNELTNFKKEKNISSTELFLMSRFYRKINDVQGINSSIDSLISKFPETAMAIEYSSSDLRQKFWKEQDFTKKIELFNEYKIKYPNNSNEEGQNRINSHLANFLSILSVKYIKSNKFEEWEKEVFKLDSSTFCDVLNRSALEILNKKSNLQIAERFAKQAILIKKITLTKPRIKWKESPVLTDKQVLSFREEWLSDYIDDYGKILFEQNKKEEALIAYKEAVFYGKSNKTEHNERYIQTLFDLKKYREAIDGANKFMLLGKSTPTIKAIYDKLTNNFENTPKKSNWNIDNSLLISEETPSIVLKDINDKEVNLKDFKGKTVVLDFWASWCNACIKGFPTMYNFKEYFNDNKGIVFLFINTLEKKDLSKDEIIKIIQKETYNFALLFDNDDKASKQLQIDGLPTKLIIDKNGIIRYKELGNIDSKENSEKFLKLIEMVSR